MKELINTLKIKIEECEPETLKKIKIVSIIIFLMWLLIPPSSLRGLAYDSKRQFGYTVYIKENGEYEPYLVLAKNYNCSRKVLLFRKYALDEPMPYGTDYTGEHRTGYYKDCLIDIFLNNEFVETLDIKNQIVDSDIGIIESMPRADFEFEKISRKVFLLAYSEVVGYNKYFNGEGKMLKYFKHNVKRHIRTTKAGMSIIWKLRTWDLGQFYTTTKAIGYDGGIGASEVATSNYVMPAFCLNPDTKIELKWIDWGLPKFVLVEN